MTMRWALTLLLAVPCSAVDAQSIRVTSTAQEVTVFKTGTLGESVGGDPNGVVNGNCTLGEAILAVNRRRNVDDCIVRDAGGTAMPFPASGPVTIALAPFATYTLTQWATTLYGPTGLPAIGAAVEGPFATAAPSEIVIEGKGATIERAGDINSLHFRLFAIAGSVRVSASELVPARETNPLLTPAPGHLLSAGSLTLRDLVLRNGFVVGGSGANGGGGGLGAGGAIFNGGGTLRIERCTFTSNQVVGGLGGSGILPPTGSGGGMSGDASTTAGGGGGGFAGNASVSSGGGTVSNANATLAGLNGGGAIGSAASFGGGGADGGIGGFGGGGSGRGGPAVTAGRGGFGGGAGRAEGAPTLASGNGFGGGGSINFSPGFGGGIASTANAASGGGGLGAGGAVFSTDGVLDIVNSTFHANGVTPGNAATNTRGSALGAHVFARNGRVELVHVTHDPTTSFNLGIPGLFVLADGASTQMAARNSVLPYVEIESLDLAVVQNNGTNAVERGRIEGDSLLGGLSLEELANNGGLVPTMHPQQGSPVIDAGLDVDAAGLETDQRGAGFARIVGSRVDLGAVEVQPIASLEVRNTDNAGLYSLRQTMLDAATNGAQTIRFAAGVSGTISLQSALPSVGTAALIGPGADVITLQRVAGGNYPVLTIPAGITTVVSGLTLTNGITTGEAGGLVNAGTLNASALTIRDNAGRGISNTLGATLDLRDSTLSGNTDGAGSALLNRGRAVLANVTISGNALTIGNGGTVFNEGQPAGVQPDLRLFNVTIAGNITAGAANSAIISGATLRLYNSILANPGPAPQLTNVGTLVEALNNLALDASIPGGNGNLQNTVPQLGSLQNNGGRTFTLLPLAGSPAINAGSNGVLDVAFLANPPAFDQRGSGFPRIVQGTVDIGAVEVGCALADIAPASLPNALLGVAYTQTLSASGGTAPYVFTQISGALPAGIALAANGDLAGTPTAFGSFDFVAGARDAGQCTRTRNYTLVVNAGTDIFANGFE
jgi:hypothetical protein